ncbi:MAG TPA: thiamine phosphate synthase [Thermoanaerobaculia bacterium]
MTARLLAISDLGGAGEEYLDDWLAALGGAGVEAVQIREKALDDRALYDLVHRSRALLPAGVRLLVNGRLDVALAAGADGAHLPAGGVPLAALRRRFGPGVLLGRSTHRPEEVEAARRDGADYVTFGPVYPTPSKQRFGAPPGLHGLADAVSRISGAEMPVYALGGVTLERLAEVASAGARGAAGIRLFRAAAELPRLVAAAAAAFRRWPDPEIHRPDPNPVTAKTPGDPL